MLKQLINSLKFSLSFLVLLTTLLPSLLFATPSQPSLLVPHPLTDADRPFRVPEYSQVTSRIWANDEGKVSNPVEISLYSQNPDDEFVENFRRPFLHVSIEDVLQKTGGHLTGMDLDKIFHRGTDLSQYQAIAHFAHGIAGYQIINGKKIHRPVDSASDKTLYWYAILPKKVGTVSTPTKKGTALQVEWFAEGPGNHMQLHFSLNTPILLIPEKNVTSVFSANSYFEDRRSIPRADLDVYSAGKTDARQNDLAPVLIKGEIVYALMGFKSRQGLQNFSFQNGITGELSIGYILASASHMVMDQLTRGSYIEEYPLQMTANEERAMLNYVLNKDNDASDIYSTVFQNCIKESLNVVLAGLISSRGESFIDSDQFNPYTVPGYLEKKGLIRIADVVALNKLYQQDAAAHEGGKNSNRYKFLNTQNLQLKSAYSSLQSNVLDSFARQLAYKSSSERWDSKALNNYIGFMSKEAQKHNFKSILEFKNTLAKDTSLSAQEKTEMLRIHSSVLDIISSLKAKYSTGASDEAQAYLSFLSLVRNVSSRK